MTDKREPDGLTALIRERIRTGGLIGFDDHGRQCPCLTFRDYMDIVLYDPELGYYRAGKTRIGKEGDFYTSAYIGEAMGERLADWIAVQADERTVFSEGGNSPIEVVDWGGGTGRLARQMLESWKTSERPVAARLRVTVVDGNPVHRKEAEEQLTSWIGAGKATVADPFTYKVMAKQTGVAAQPAIVVANELLDAFPVHRVTRRHGVLTELAVAWDEQNGCPVSCFAKPDHPRLKEWLSNEGNRLVENQIAEVPLDAADWVSSLASSFPQGTLLVLIDYGDDTEELLSPHRMDGTLLAYYRHQAYTDPYVRLGEQDLTAHVNFDVIRTSASEAGWREIWYGTQKRFLLEAGLLERLAAHTSADPFHPDARRNRAIRQLLLSDGMSELFKVQVWEKAR